MDLDRRHLLALTAATAGASAAAMPARAAATASPTSALGVDAGHFGLRPGSPDDQSRALQRAIDETARTIAPPAAMRSASVNDGRRDGWTCARGTMGT